MAQKTQITLIDDVDGSSADETVVFGLDGVNYEIDLNAEHARELRDAAARFVGHARKVGGRAPSRAGNRTRGNGRDYEPAAVREWAASRSIDLPARGRIPGAVLDQYRAAR
ncbi:histone-like nucleoid-structuring protein Lsr2 [Cellulomonas endometrii]|uniref:histone-like nucleoid-structuring protein Lsr2 n=1 Tax=Cellulomonas endometrii TaxID=3036301 RepID=UPI0024AE31A1|nr:Lsr2 family protein [Cellulomonas endometrii]